MATVLMMNDATNFIKLTTSRLQAFKTHTIEPTKATLNQPKSKIISWLHDDENVCVNGSMNDGTTAMSTENRVMKATMFYRNDKVKLLQMLCDE